MKPGEGKQLLAGIAAGIGTLLLTLVTRMPLPLVCALPIGAYFGAYMASKPRVRIGGIALSDANGDDMRQLMKEGYDDLVVLQYASNRIKEPAIRALTESLYARGVNIYEHLQQNPDKISKARRFISYYLDTASGIVAKYENLSRSRVQGSSVERATEEVKQGLSVLVQAFDKEFEHLMQGEIMDIKTEVKVLSQTFRMEK